MVSVRSTEVTPEAGAGGGVCPSAVNFAAAVLPPDLAGAGTAAGAAFAGCGLAALLEMTNLRRTGGVLVFATFGLLRLLTGLLLGAVALLFDINNQTKSTPVQEK